MRVLRGARDIVTLFCDEDERSPARSVELADQVSRVLDQGRNEGRRAEDRRGIRHLADTQAAELPAEFRPPRAPANTVVCPRFPPSPVPAGPHSGPYGRAAFP